MQMLEIIALENGAHRNQTFDGVLPDGWALIPEEMEPLEHFPFGEVSFAEVNGLLTLSGWTPGELPEPEPVPEPEPTAQDDTDAMLVDHELRLTLLELDV